MIKSLEGGWSWEEGALGREEQRKTYIYMGIALDFTVEKGSWRATARWLGSPDQR